jgi:hypothetical protein
MPSQIEAAIQTHRARLLAGDATALDKTAQAGLLSPRFPPDHLANRRVRDVSSFRHVSKKSAIGIERVQPPEFPDGLPVQARQLVLFSQLISSVFRSMRMTILGDHVLHVVLGTTKEQMTRRLELDTVDDMDTGGIVADAVPHVTGMADKEAFRDRPVDYFPCELMSVAIVLRSLGELSISRPVATRSPQPARRFIIDARHLIEETNKRTAFAMRAPTLIGAKSSRLKFAPLGSSPKTVSTFFTVSKNRGEGDGIISVHFDLQRRDAVPGMPDRIARFLRVNYTRITNSYLAYWRFTRGHQCLAP